MIKLVRVDHRLLHGQVAFSWTNGLNADCILVASDSVVNDEVWKTTLKLGKPSGVKLVIKNMEDSIKALNSGVTDKYNLIIVVQTIADAKRLAEGYTEISVTKQISKQVFVTEEEQKIVKELIGKGIEVEIRALVDDSKILASKVL